MEIHIVSLRSLLLFKLYLFMGVTYALWVSCCLHTLLLVDLDQFFGPIELVWFGLRVFGRVFWVFGMVSSIHLFSLFTTLDQENLSLFDIVSMDKSNWDFWLIGC